MNKARFTQLSLTRNLSKFCVILFISMLGFKTFAQNIDQIAIRTVIEKETETWRTKDVQGHADCWAIKPYGRILVSTEDGTALDFLPTEMVNIKTDIMGFEGKSVNTNYKFSLNGNTSWVSYDQVKTAPNGNKSYSYEMRMLEKIKNQWKIVGMSVHHYKPKTNKNR